ncbi:MAG: AMP-binding protein, partial [Gemmatimonadota bacterium]|nr:AMP-binding protein [Gemmatimonadota bacterium]
WTYADLDRAVTERADGLRAVGVRAGHAVPVTLDATADGVIHLLALWRAGVTPAPLNPGLTQAERDARVAALTDEPCDAQAVLWTSGTEGRPRGVEISYRGLAASARASQARLDLGVDDVWLASLSPAHVGGLALITRALMLGSRLVALGAFDAERTAALIAGRDLPAGTERPVTHASLVPTQLLRLLDAWGSAPPPASFRCALVGGARAPTALVRAALDAGWPVALTYGLSEATSQVATAPPALTKRKPGTVGAALDGVDVTFGDDGEILVRGATLATAYVGPRAGPVADAEGWHHTGDLGHMDDEGHLWVTGRRLDRIVSGGVTIDAVEVEEVLRSHASVMDACVVGLPDMEWGERVAAWVVPAEDGLDLEALDAFLRDRLSAPKRPRVFHVSDALPRNANGKVDRGAVREGVAGSQS